MTSELANGDSDYGSDFTADEELMLHEILDQLPANLSSRHQYAQNPPTARNLGHSDRLPTLFAPRTVVLRDSREKKASSELQISDRQIPNLQDSSKSKPIMESKESHRARQPILDSQPSVLQDHDQRSPLERWRSKPRKSLSVTDLVSPAWCELSYYYSLSKHGRVRPTAAMKQGSAIHKTLEDQVHSTVAINLQSKEEAWGLRIWNVIQGLRTLRETGMTRELEVWGVVDGVVINGVIDQLSFVCPDKELEEHGNPPVPSDQRAAHPQQQQHTLEAFCSASGNAAHVSNSVVKNLRTMQRKTSRVYLTDVKTRSNKHIPKGASFRPTLMQLMLYQSLLSDLAANIVDANIIFARYDLDPDAPFSDHFLAQVGSLNEVFHDASPDIRLLPDALPPSLLQSQSQSPPSPSSQDSLHLLLAHNSLRQLWSQMSTEFRTTMPKGADSIGRVMKVEYRSRADATILGIKTFLQDRHLVRRYVDDEMRWWRGEREAQGVPIEEAFKCHSCEFAPECEWRLERLAEVEGAAVAAAAAAGASRSRTRSVV